MPQSCLGFKVHLQLTGAGTPGRVPVAHLLLKKMTEKTIPNPNPAPVRRNTVSED